MKHRVYCLVLVCSMYMRLRAVWSTVWSQIRVLSELIYSREWLYGRS